MEQPDREIEEALMVDILKRLADHIDETVKEVLTKHGVVSCAFVLNWIIRYASSGQKAILKGAKQIGLQEDWGDVGLGDGESLED